MQVIHVDLGAHAYDIEIEAGLLPKIGAKVAALLPKAKKAAIISDTNVAPLYADKLQKSLEAAGLSVVKVIIEAGEQSKNMAVLSSVLEQLAQGGLTRSDVVLTLGGGVVGDLGGFAAASYMRGVAFVQVPTSLLAQIDSSVGGKVAVDLAAGKNLAGAFYQPKAVFIDTDLLATLSTRFLHDGLAEAIKYGCIILHQRQQVLAYLLGLLQQSLNLALLRSKLFLANGQIAHHRRQGRCQSTRHSCTTAAARCRRTA